MLSVIICTHNPREEYLRRALNALDKQSLSKDCWELLLVDNASKKPLADQWNLSWHPGGRHILEEELGLTPARRRGIREAKGELLVFIDDDNVVDSEYLERACRLSATLPMLGCLGAGRLEPEFEVEPSEELRPYTGMLALRTVDRIRWANVPEDCWIPWGAGLVVTRCVADRYYQVVSESRDKMSLDRKGAELNSGGDDEFSWIACSLGLGWGTFPELKIIHLIGRHRVQKEYLLRIAEGHAFSSSFRKYLNGEPLLEIVNEPKLSNVLGALCKLSLSTFFYEGQRWWSTRRNDRIKSEFERVFNDGVRRAHDLINARKQA